MAIFTAEIELSTDRPRQTIDITARTRALVEESGVQTGICSLYAHGATAAVMIQENADPNISVDVLACLDGLIPDGKWLHDRIDGNGASHIQAAIVGPTEVVPIRDGQLFLSTWQNVFLCDFDGPRKTRRVIVTILGDP